LIYAFRSCRKKKKIFRIHNKGNFGFGSLKDIIGNQIPEYIKNINSANVYLTPLFLKDLNCILSMNFAPISPCIKEVPGFDNFVHVNVLILVSKYIYLKPLESNSFL